MDESGYRWGRATAGEIPAGAPEQGHGWRWRDTDDDGQEREALWLVRSLSDGDGAVLLGRVARGQEACVGPEQRPVDDYEVLLDPGAWGAPEVVDTGDDLRLDFVSVGGVACGRLADGTALYATLRDREGEGYEPGGDATGISMDFMRQVLLAPSDAAAGAPAEAPAQPEPAGPVAVVSALDLKGEVVEIANVGDAPLDLGGWRLRDESTGKPYVFPAGTVVAAGASVRVRSGPGAARPPAGELAWKTASVWNDSGDTAFLENPSGALVSSRKG